MDQATDAGSQSGTSARIVVERPPPGLARGKYAWPPWGIGLLGGTVVLFGLLYLVWRVRRLRRP